jgi:hypothetical protein
VGFEEFKADRKVEESGVQMPGDVVEAGLQSGSWAYLQKRGLKPGLYKSRKTKTAKQRTLRRAGP